MFKHLVSALLLFIVLTCITGIAYPLLITIFAQTIFPAKANGNIVYHADKAVGSIYIGQQFISNKYFWCRPSVTTPQPYNASNSMASNLALSNPLLLQTIKDRVRKLHLDANNTLRIPFDLVTASASGLDPDISVPAAIYQVARVAKARNLNQETIINLIRQSTIANYMGIFGSERLNVLQLNLALDRLSNGI